MKEIKFDNLNKAMAETCPYDYDTMFISIGCDVMNACASVVSEMIECDVINVSECHNTQKELFSAVLGTIADMAERLAKGEMPVYEEQEANNGEQSKKAEHL